MNPLIYSHSTNNIIHQISILADKLTSKCAQNITLVSTLIYTLMYEVKSFEQRMSSQPPNVNAYNTIAPPLFTAKYLSMVTTQHENVTPAGQSPVPALPRLPSQPFLITNTTTTTSTATTVTTTPITSIAKETVPHDTCYHQPAAAHDATEYHSD